MELLILIGIFYCPIFTLGCVLMHYDHPVLGLIAIIVLIFFSDKEEDKEKSD